MKSLSTFGSSPGNKNCIIIRVGTIIGMFLFVVFLVDRVQFVDQKTKIGLIPNGIQEFGIALQAENELGKKRETINKN